MQNQRFLWRYSQWLGLFHLMISSECIWCNKLDWNSLLTMWHIAVWAVHFPFSMCYIYSRYRPIVFGSPPSLMLITQGCIPCWMRVSLFSSLLIAHRRSDSGRSGRSKHWQFRLLTIPVISYHTVFRIYEYICIFSILMFWHNIFQCFCQALTYI